MSRMAAVEESLPSQPLNVAWPSLSSKVRCRPAGDNKALSCGTRTEPVPFATLHAAHQPCVHWTDATFISLGTVHWCLSILSLGTMEGPLLFSSKIWLPASNGLRRAAQEGRADAQKFSSSHGPQCSDKYAITQKFWALPGLSISFLQKPKFTCFCNLIVSHKTLSKTLQSFFLAALIRLHVPLRLKFPAPW